MRTFDGLRLAVTTYGPDDAPLTSLTVDGGVTTT